MEDLCVFLIDERERDEVNDKLKTVYIWKDFIQFEIEIVSDPHLMLSGKTVKNVGPLDSSKYVIPFSQKLGSLHYLFTH